MSSIFYLPELQSSGHMLSVRRPVGLLPYKEVGYVIFDLDPERLYKRAGSGSLGRRPPAFLRSTHYKIQHRLQRTTRMNTTRINTQQESSLITLQVIQHSSDPTLTQHSARFSWLRASSRIVISIMQVSSR